MKGFLNFVREQGVVGLAVGIILGGGVGKLVGSLVDNIINPVLGIILGAAGGLKDYSVEVMGAKLMWGAFTASLIDFLVIALVVYFGVMALGLNKLDKKKA